MSPGRRDPSGAERSRTAPLWVKVAVFLHLFAVIVWALPNLPEATMSGKVRPSATQWILFWNQKYLKTLNPVKAYLFATGTWQYWDMFAPNPADTDWYGDAEVEYRDGTKTVVGYPRMYKLSIPQKFIKERYRKFFERAHDANFRGLPAFGQQMALEAYRDPNNPPVVVRIVRHWLKVADPGEKQPTEYGRYGFYTYTVDQKWLQRMVRDR